MELKQRRWLCIAVMCWGLDGFQRDVKNNAVSLDFNPKEKKILEFFIKKFRKSKQKLVKFLISNGMNECMYLIEMISWLLPFPPLAFFRCVVCVLAVSFAACHSESTWIRTAARYKHRARTTPRRTQSNACCGVLHTLTERHSAGSQVHISRST